jgi:hypothetical protein
MINEGKANIQEKIPVKSETLDAGPESNVESQEDLVELAKESISEGGKKVEYMETEGKERIGGANDTLGLSEEKLAGVKDSTGVEGKTAELQGKANKTLDDLEKELMELIMSKGVAPEKIEEINQQIDTVDKEHQAKMEQMRLDHEEEMKKIRAAHETELKSIADTSDERKEATERAIFGGKTLEEAKADADKVLKDIEAKAKKFVENPRGLEAVTSEGAPEGVVTSDGKSLEDIQKEMKEMEEASKKKSEDMINRMEKYAAKVTQETIDGVKKAREQFKQCPQCGKMAPANVNFCGDCGVKMGFMENKKCSKCGKESSPTSSFCGDCGTKL